MPVGDLGEDGLVAGATRFEGQIGQHRQLRGESAQQHLQIVPVFLDRNAPLKVVGTGVDHQIGVRELGSRELVRHDVAGRGAAHREVDDSDRAPGAPLDEGGDQSDETVERM